MSPLETPPCPQKRAHSPSSFDQEIERRRRAKRYKCTSVLYPSAVWDLLPEIHLTRKALAEFDRRTNLLRPAAQPERKPRSTTRLLRSDTRRLALMARKGGPDLTKLRGCADAPRAVPMGPPTSKPTKKDRRPSAANTTAAEALESMALKTGTVTATTGPYDIEFAGLCERHGIYREGFSAVDGSEPPVPANLDEIKERLRQPRRSLSPSTFADDAFRDFKQTNRNASSESRVANRVMPIIWGAKDWQYHTDENRQFVDLEKLCPGVTIPTPDKYDGVRQREIDDQVRQDLKRYIIPCSDWDTPAAPNNFMEFKGACGRLDILQRQAMYAGAVGARGMFELQNYPKETPEYDNHAYTIVSAYHPGGGLLMTWATHPRQSANGNTEYHITELGSYTLTSDVETFRRGATALRNARDLSKEHRDRFVHEANLAAQRPPSRAGPRSRRGRKRSASPRPDRLSRSRSTARDSPCADHYSSDNEGADEPAPKRPRKARTATGRSSLSVEIHAEQDLSLTARMLMPPPPRPSKVEWGGCPVPRSEVRDDAKVWASMKEGRRRSSRINGNCTVRVEVDGAEGENEPATKTNGQMKQVPPLTPSGSDGDEDGEL